MANPMELFRVQFDALITEIKQDLCREVDAKADGLFGLLQEEWRRQMQSTGDQVVAENEENNGNTGDDTVSGHVKVEDESMKCECDSESEWDTDDDIEVKKEESEDGDNGDEHDDDEQTDDAAAGSSNDAPNNQNSSIPNEPVRQVASTSGLRRSNRTSIKRRQITPDNVTSSDEEDSGSKDKRKKARVNATPAARNQPRQEATAGQEDSKKIITISLNCTVTGCALNFPDKGQLIEHLKRQHHIDRYPCHVRGCTLSFTNKPKFGEHLRSAHVTLTRWPCGHCALQCANYNHLSTHVLQYHQLGRFVCGHAGCDFPASTYRRKVLNHQMQQHKLAIHQCTFAGCEKAFKLSADLKRHIRTHTGERPFVCVHCQQAFTIKSNLTVHVRTQH